MEHWELTELTIIENWHMLFEFRWDFHGIYVVNLGGCGFQ